MLNAISIRNFRGILQCDINVFNQINVFIGEFGSGKSTLLDAVYLLKLSSEAADCVKKIMKRRTGRAPDLTSLWYTYEPNNQIVVKYTFQDSSYEVQLSVDPKDSTTVRLHTVTDAAPSAAEITWNGDFRTGRAAVGKEANFARDIALLDNEILHDVSKIERGVLDPMKHKQLDRKFLELLTGAFPTSRNYEFLSASPRQQQESRCYLELEDARVRIDDISDGLRNGVCILSTACLLRDTALLLEEPENNMHPKALDKLLEALVHVCKSNQTQLFVTTHRPEVLASLVEYGKERVTIFHFSRKNGEVRVSPSQWTDTRILLDLGWDVGRLVKGYEKYVIVEGDRDKLVLDESFQKTRGVLPERLWITIIPARGLDRNFNVVLKALLPTQREIFALPDLDKKSLDEKRNQLAQSIKQLKSESYDVQEKDDAVILSGKGMTSSLKLKNILPLGDPHGLSKREFKFESFSADDYILEAILLNGSTWSTLGIAGEDVEKSKKCKNSKSVLEDIMKMNNEKIRTLIRDSSSLPDGLVQIVKIIAGDT